VGFVLITTLLSLLIALSFSLLFKDAKRTLEYTEVGPIRKKGTMVVISQVRPGK
jgi:hypothetical protein